jgi:hypothetical protein
VNVNLDTGPKHPLTSIAPFLALTKVIAAKL